MIIAQSDLRQLSSICQPSDCSSAGRVSTSQELVEQWRVEQEREETIESVRRGVEDADAGRFRSVAEFDKAIREKLAFRPSAMNYGLEKSDPSRFPMTTAAQDLLKVFDTLPPADQHEVTVAILRRTSATEDIPEAALQELAAELFRSYDAEEAAHL